MSNYKFAKVGDKFDEELRKLAYERMTDIDKKFGKPLSKERLTNLLPKLPAWAELVKQAKQTPRGIKDE